MYYLCSVDEREQSTLLNLNPHNNIIMRTFDYTSNNIKSNVFLCENLGEVATILRASKVGAKREINSVARSFGMYDYNISIANNINQCQICIRYTTTEDNETVIKFPCHLIQDFLMSTTRPVNVDTESHYYPKMSRKRLSNMRIAAYEWKTGKTVRMSYAYVYLIDEDAIKELISFLKGREA